MTWETFPFSLKESAKTLKGEREAATNKVGASGGVELQRDRVAFLAPLALGEGSEGICEAFVLLKIEVQALARRRV